MPYLQNEASAAAEEAVPQELYEGARALGATHEQAAVPGATAGGDFDGLSLGQ